MLTEAIECFPWPGPKVLKIKSLVKEADQWSARRNEIAHGLVRNFNFNNNHRGWYLMSAEYASKKRPRLKHYLKKSTSPQEDWALGSYAFTSGQIDYLRLSFADLRSRVIDTAIPTIMGYWSRSDEAEKLAAREEIAASIKKAASSGEPKK
jgi:hypothetical protein